MSEEKNKKKYSQAEECPITVSIDVIGGKWKPIIIWVLMKKPFRFGELHKTIDGIALKVLSRQLKELESDGLITRKVYAAVPPKVEYALSAKGESLSEVMNSLADWSRNNLL